MPTDVIEAKPNNDAQLPAADVKPSATLLGSETVKATEAPPVDAVKTEPAKDGTQPVKTPEQIKAEADKAEVDKKSADIAPETYAEFKVPEKVKLDTDSLTEAQAVFKDLNLSQDKAQRVMDLAVKHVEKVHAQQAQALEKAGETWRKENESDKELGGANFKKSNEAALRFRDRFTTPEERKKLEPIFNTAWGNFPELWKIFVRGGLAIGEDRAVDGGVTTPVKSAADVMYPTMK